MAVVAGRRTASEAAGDNRLGGVSGRSHSGARRRAGVLSVGGGGLWVVWQGGSPLAIWGGGGDRGKDEDDASEVP